jgi:imidazolonepropionase-like amidohydrolase
MELGFLNKAGIPAFDLIKIATLNGAIYMGQDKNLGSIEVGKYADLLVLNADPAADVNNFQAINAVVKNGQRIDLAKLDLPVNHRK